MEALIATATTTVVEILVIGIGFLVILFIEKARRRLDSLKKFDDLGIVDLITDRVVEYAEAELKGQSGREKRDFAVHKAIEILASKGIKVSETEIIAGIENGVNKLTQPLIFAQGIYEEPEDSE